MKRTLVKHKLIICILFAATALAGCGDSDTSISTTTNASSNANSIVVPTPSLEAPTATDDDFQALGNATLNQAASGVLANDTTKGGTIAAFDTTGSNGGTMALNADGSFTYTPVADFVGSETFSYTLSNDEGDSTATITFTITGLGRFVDNSGQNGSGSQSSPFNNLQDALDVAQSGDTIYVARGNGNDTGVAGGFTLPEGVSLIGEGTGLILAQTIEPAGTAPVISGPITCEGNNVIQGFAINGSTGKAIEANKVSDITISRNSFENVPEDNISLEDITGTVTITGNDFIKAFSGPSRDSISLKQLEGDVTFVVTNNTFQNPDNFAQASLCEVETGGISVVNVTFSNNSAQGTFDGEFDDGLIWEHDGTAACTLTAEGNNMSGFNDGAFEIYADEGPVNSTLSGNTFANSDYPIHFEFSYSTIVLSGNMFTGCDNPIFVFNEYADGTCIVVNNNFDDSSEAGFHYESVGSNLETKLALRNNTFVNSNDNAIEIELFDDGTNVCCDITGNKVDQNMIFRDDGNTGSITVKRFGSAAGDELKIENNFTGGADVVVTGDAVVDADPGFCQIP